MESHLHLSKRTKIDVEKYVKVLQSKERLLQKIDLISLAIAIAALSTSILSQQVSIKAISVLFMLLSLSRIFYSMWKYRRTLKQLAKPAEGKLMQRATLPLSEREITFSSLVPDETDASLGFNVVTRGEEPVLTSAMIDASLRKGDFLLVLDNNKKTRVDAFINEHKAILAGVLLLKRDQAIHDGSFFFNDNKFCLARNLNLDSKRALYHVGSYYDSFLTNELTSYVLEREGHIYRDFRQWFPAIVDDRGQAVLLTLSISSMDDHVGISTLAITRDRFLVMWRQSERADQSKLLVVPSGSGSCDAGDIRNSSLFATIAYAMQRELCEESLLKKKGYKPDQIGATRLLGFFRWIRRGGKPEFVGISRLTVDADDLWPDWTELEDHPNAHFRIKCQEPNDLAGALSRISAWPKISAPLAHIVYCLQNMLKVDSGYITDFLFGNAPGVPLDIQSADSDS